MTTTSACPHPEKKVYRSRAKARRFERRSMPPVGEKKTRLEPYLCVCGSWHLAHPLGTKPKGTSR